MTPTASLSLKSAHRFLAVFFSVLGVGLLTIAILNVSADPFCVFGATRRPGFNDHPPFTGGFDRMAKPYELLRVQPRTVLMGSSTAHSGFIHLSWWETGLPKPAYNYALLSANVHEVSLSFAQALREAPVETAIMVADFYAYNAHYVDNERFTPARLLAATHRGFVGFKLDDLGAFTLGIDALKLSWQTVMASRAATRASVVNAAPATGTPSASVPGFRWADRFREMEHSYPPKWFPPPNRVYEFADRQGHDRLADFDAMLRLCVEKGVRLIVIIPPVHARFQEAMATAGAWPHYEAFKRALVAHTQTCLATPGATGRAPAIELWDFSLFNDRTREAVPPDGGPAMQNWLDSAHFSPDFGHDILEEIQGRPSSVRPPLGVRLVPGPVALDAHLANIRAGLTAFRQAQPDVIADVRKALGIAAPPPFSL